MRRMERWCDAVQRPSTLWTASDKFSFLRHKAGRDHRSLHPQPAVSHDVSVSLWNVMLSPKIALEQRTHDDLPCKTNSEAVKTMMTVGSAAKLAPDRQHWRKLACPKVPWGRKMIIFQVYNYITGIMWRRLSASLPHPSRGMKDN